MEDIYQEPEKYPVIIKNEPTKKDIYQELKSDFKKQWTYKKSNFLTYILAIILIICIYLFIHKEINTVHEVSKSIDYIQVDWKNIEVSEIKIIKIPHQVYDSMEINPNIPQEVYNQINIDRSREKYLLWDKKHILLITWDGCPYARRFRKELDNVFNKNTYLTRYYDKDIKETWQYIEFSCFDKNCASIRLFENCWEWICIINPVAKEIIVDNSQNAKQILPLLKSYENRQNESLIK